VEIPWFALLLLLFFYLRRYCFSGSPYGLGYGRAYDNGDAGSKQRY
jgi:hypothetical protein